MQCSAALIAASWLISERRKHKLIFESVLSSAKLRGVKHTALPNTATYRLLFTKILEMNPELNPFLIWRRLYYYRKAVNLAFFTAWAILARSAIIKMRVRWYSKDSIPKSKLIVAIVTRPSEISNIFQLSR